MPRGRDRLPKTPQRVRRASDVGDLTASGVLVVDFDGDITLTFGSGLANVGDVLIVDFADDEVLVMGTDDDFGIGYDSANDELRLVSGDDLTTNVWMKVGSTGNFDFGNGTISTMAAGYFGWGLTSTDGGLKVVDPTIYELSDSIGARSMEWDLRHLIDETNTQAVVWQSSDRGLYDATGDLVLEWATGQMFSGSLDLSLDWTARELYASDGLSVMLDWSTDGTLDAIDNDFNTTGDIQCQAISLGGGGAPAFPLDMVMSATDGGGLFIDGRTNDYTGTGTVIDTCMEMVRDHAVASGQEPVNLYGLRSEIIPKHTNAVIANSKLYFGTYGLLDGSASWSSTAIKAVEYTGAYGQVLMADTYTGSGAGKLISRGSGVYGNFDCTATFVSVNSTSHTFYGGRFECDFNPALVTGTHVFTVVGCLGRATGTTDGTQLVYGGRFQADGGDTSYGVYIKASTGTTAWGIRDDSGANWALDADSQKIFWGESQDFFIEFDGTYGRLDCTGDPIRIGDTTTNCAEIASSGDLTFIGTAGLAYGEISVEDNAVATAIAVAGTAVQVTVFDTNGESNNSTPDHTNDHITILKAGRYLITVSLVVESAAGAAFIAHAHIRKNNGATEYANIHAHRQLSGGGGDRGSISMSGIVNLAANDTVELWVANDTNTADIIVEDCTVSVVQIGGAG